MNKLPSIRQLRYLLALHHKQHFGRAADSCFISQSTLSAAITNLEELLGIQLLERDHKTFIFTAEGNEIVKQSRFIIEKLDELTAYAQNLGEPMTGQMSLGCIPTIAPFVLSDIAQATRQQYPHLQLLLREDTTDNLLHALAEGQIDILLLALPYDTDDFHVEILATDPFNLVMHKELLRDFNQDMNTWPEGSVFLLEREHCLTNQALQVCKLKDQKKINAFFATSLHTLIPMISSQLGVTFLPQLAINSGILEGTGLVYQKIATKNAHRRIGMAWRKTSNKQQSYQLLLKLIKNLVINKCQV